MSNSSRSRSRSRSSPSPTSHSTSLLGTSSLSPHNVLQLWGLAPGLVPGVGGVQASALGDGGCVVRAEPLIAPFLTALPGGTRSLRRPALW